ncbi:uncharacterized protein Hap1MRO34_024153 isoform 1-T2 [Clarias gariepinus]
MNTSVACKTSYVAPPLGQYAPEPVNVTISQKGADRTQVVSSDFNIMEMTEVEYTHIQHLIHSHMESQDGTEEISINPPSSTDRDIESSCKVCPSSDMASACQVDASSSSSLPTNTQFVLGPSNDRREDGQEVKMLLYSDPNCISSLGPRTPTSNSEVPSFVLAKVRGAMEEGRERTDRRRAPLLGSRPNPSSRVCLEKRFDCDSCDLTKKEESQAAIMKTFLSMLHTSTDIPGIVMHSQPEKWPKAEKSGAAECARPCTGYQGSHGQFCQLLESSNLPEDIPSKNLSVSKSSDSVSRSPCVIFTDTTSEEQIMNIENEVELKVVNRVRTRGARILQAQDPNIMHGSGKWRSGCDMPGRKPAQRTRCLSDISQRKQRHNLKERDRRRRIRLCCDELNMLVPFCYSETDKATTLQWTTAYLKYIQEIYGDSLKQNFENTFCGETGVRIKPRCADDVSGSQNSEIGTRSLK